MFGKFLCGGLPMVAVLFVLWSNATLAQQTPLAVRIDALDERGFGRFLITLPDRTRFFEHDIEVEGNVLVLRLAEPVLLDIAKEVEPLERYIRVARQDPEGTILRFALNIGVTVNSMTAGEHLFLDFLPSNWVGEPPAIPERIVRKLEDRAEEALEIANQNALVNKKNKVKAKLDVRVGRHPTFSRFEFSWNVPFETSFRREGSKAIVSFNRPTDVNVRALNADLPPLVAKIESKRLNRATEVTLRLAPEAKVRTYFDNGDYILDLTSDALAKNAVEDPALSLFAGALPELPPTATNVTEPETVSQQRVVAAAPSTVAAQSDQVTDENAEGEGSSPASEDQEVASDAPAPRPPERPSEDGTSSGPQEQASSATAEAAERPARINPEAVDPDLKKIKGVSTVSAAINQAGDSLRLEFPFDRPTPSAVFRRGKAVWMVFNTDNDIDISALRSINGDFIKGIEALEKGDFKAIILNLRNVELASAAIDEHTWMIAVGSSVLRGSEPLSIDRAVDEKGDLFLTVGLTEAVASVAFDDPTVGDVIQVVVANPPSRGLVREQRFVQLKVLPSTHALAFVSLDNTVFPEIAEDVVRLQSKNAFNLSPTKDLRASSDGKFKGDEWFDSPFETENVVVSSIASLADKERALVKSIVDAEAETLPKLRVDLAQFYAANGFGPEALATLRQVVEEAPDLKNKSAYVLTKAASEVSMGRYHDAMKTLGGEAFADDPDAAVWRTIAASYAGNLDLAGENVANGRLRLAGYDANTQQEFFLAAASAAIKNRDIGSGKSLLANVITRTADAYQLGFYEILQGEIASAEGRDEDARLFFDRAMESDDPRIAANARLHKITLDHETGRADNATTIENLERFAAVWRNDHLELTALRKLASVLGDEKQYRRAFQLVETSVLSDPDSEIARGLQDDMKALFVELFHEGGADELAAVDALSLYYDFKELTPIGRRGDEIVRYLASRLIDLDLLPQAAELLEHQVDNRLAGAARARVATDLAVVQMFDRKPHKAIATLRRSNTANLPASLDRQRRLVEAFALSKINKPDLALDILSSMSGKDVERLRATVNWDAKRWLVAGELLEKSHSGVWSDPAPLEPIVRLDIMRAAIAYSLAEDEFALNRLNQKFGAKMAESPDALTFDILAKSLSESSFESDLAIDSVLSIDSNDSFLHDYRRRYFSRPTVGSGA
ncbi:MAG: hypothetical protein AAFW47_03480 [Pseudomonadota bacterium]